MGGKQASLTDDPWYDSRRQQEANVANAKWVSLDHWIDNFFVFNAMSIDDSHFVSFTAGHGEEDGDQGVRRPIQKASRQTVVLRES